MAAPAGQQHKTRGGLRLAWVQLACLGQVANEFVQGVVAAHVFHHVQHLPAGIGPGGSVHGLAGVVQGLLVVQGLHGGQHRGRIHLGQPRGGGHRGAIEVQADKAFHPADTAAGAPAHAAALALQPRHAAGGNLQIDLHRIYPLGQAGRLGAQGFDLQVVAIAGLVNDAFGE